jgi:hypothetical protein
MGAWSLKKCYQRAVTIVDMSLDRPDSVDRAGMDWRHWPCCHFEAIHSLLVEAFWRKLLAHSCFTFLMVDLRFLLAALLFLAEVALQT